MEKCGTLKNLNENNILATTVAILSKTIKKKINKEWERSSEFEWNWSAFNEKSYQNFTKI